MRPLLFSMSCTFFRILHAVVSQMTQLHGAVGCAPARTELTGLLPFCPLVLKLCLGRVGIR
jgi:hypothetical protein